MKSDWFKNKGIMVAMAGLLTGAAAMAICSAGVFKSKKATLGSSSSATSPEVAAEAETEALSSRFILPTDPESRVRMPLHTKVITDWAPPIVGTIICTAGSDKNLDGGLRFGTFDGAK